MPPNAYFPVRNFTESRVSFKANKMSLISYTYAGWFHYKLNSFPKHSALLTYARRFSIFRIPLVSSFLFFFGVTPVLVVVVCGLFVTAAAAASLPLLLEPLLLAGVFPAQLRSLRTWELVMVGHQKHKVSQTDAKQKPLQVISRSTADGKSRHDKGSKMSIKCVDK